MGERNLVAQMEYKQQQEETVCHCNVKENAELIAKILDADLDREIYKCCETCGNYFSENAAETCDDKEKTNRFDSDKLFRSFSGHSYYHGDAILSRIQVMREGKDVNQPVRPADVVSVVHGRWTRFGMDIVGHPLHCSECGFGQSNVANHIVSSYNYCTNCGAKMDKDGDER